MPDFRSLGTQEALRAPLARAGLDAVEFRTSRWTYRPSHREWMAFMAGHVVSDRLAALDEDARRACVDAVTERTVPMSSEDLGLDSEVLFAIARR